MAVLSFKAAQELTKEKIEAEVIDLRSLNPLDVKDDYCFDQKDRNERSWWKKVGKTGGVGGEIVSLINGKCF